MTLEQFLAEGYTDELANLYDREIAAHQLLRSAGVQPRKLIPFNVSPEEFWTNVIDQAFKGLIDDPSVIVWKALERYPFNAVLGKIRKKARPQALAVLYAAANPLDTIHLDLQGEFRSIRECLKEATGRGLAHLESSWATHPHELLTILSEYRPSIVHFSLHGRSNGALVFDDGKGQSRALDPMTLANVFHTINHCQRVTRVVILGGCYSQTAAETIRLAVDAVIGTTGQISDQAAIAFSQGFYNRLAALLLAPPADREAACLDDVISSGRGAMPEEHGRNLVVYPSAAELKQIRI